MVVTFLIGGGTIYAYIPFFILMILGLLSQYLISLASSPDEAQRNPGIRT